LVHAQSGQAFRHAETKLVENKVQRREQRLNAACKVVEEKRKRHQEVIMGQLGTGLAPNSDAGPAPASDILREGPSR
jgi:hypothetical protein